MDKIATHKGQQKVYLLLPRFSLKTDKTLNSIEITKLTSFFSLTRKLIAKRAESRSFFMFDEFLAENRAGFRLRGGELRLFSVIN
ncbi:hypothetical protein [Vibrio natriegens]|uniref:hypothetical protein n=1 Tax=Vibrio natriegens TaxID=691 RepID=UPI001FB9A44E|nr:hypothetical protein [Vibrio natriegens]